jgi:hypothetical protein
VIQRQTQTTQYWEENFAIEDADLEHLYNILLEDETPLTIDELALALIRNRIEREQLALQRQLHRGATVYLPKETYKVDQELTFPQFQFANGKVTSVRSGANPEVGEFDVITVDFGEGKKPREFAARLAKHKLNETNGRAADGEAASHSPDHVFAEHGRSVAATLEAKFRAKGDIVRIAGRWFPRALLATINEGHLNLAEAVLDVAGGGPLPTADLVPHLDLPDSINQKLKVFSLNYAMQEDERFDEVGPAGQVLWFLHRLEPAEVLEAPRFLKCELTETATSLPEALLRLESDLDDEFGPQHEAALDANEVTLYLTYPHLRAGTLPLSQKLATLFPTAYVTPRIRFTLVDAHTGEKRPGWVVRPGRYVFGLGEWYRKYEAPVGGTLTIKKGEAPGEVVVKIARRKPIREWVRTAGVGEGRVSFTMQKRPVSVEYDEQMIIAVDNVSAIDQVWQRLDERKPPLDKVVADMFRELAKLTTQSAVHARSLYSAVNVIRRVPPGPLFAELISRPYFVHVGDAYWRFDESNYTD